MNEQMEELLKSLREEGYTINSLPLSFGANMYRNYAVNFGVVAQVIKPVHYCVYYIAHYKTAGGVLLYRYKESSLFKLILYCRLEEAKEKIIAAIEDYPPLVPYVSSLTNYIREVNEHTSIENNN